MSDNTLSSLIDEALGALSTDCVRIGLAAIRADGGLLVEVGACRFRFDHESRDRVREWERLMDALPAAVERARLLAMHRAAAGSWPAPWSVYTTATASAWLAQLPNGTGQNAILRAADENGNVVLKPDPVSSLKGFLRSRQLHCRIRLGRNASYDSQERIITARKVIPETVAIASGKRNLADIVAMPWVRASNVHIGEPIVGPTGTIVPLQETLVPLVPIPAAALDAATLGGPSHAPWIVTAAEREALDGVDAKAHGAL